MVGEVEVEAHSPEYHKAMSSICFCEDHGITNEIEKMFPKMPYKLTLAEREQLDELERKKIEDNDPTLKNKYHSHFLKKQARKPHLKHLKLVPPNL